MHLAAEAIPLGLRITRQQVPQLLVHLGDCLVVSSLGFLEHLGSLLNLHLASRNINRRQDGVLRLRGFLEILQRCLPFCNSLGIHVTLLLQPFLLDDPEDRNYVRDVSLVVPMGEDRNADVGVIGNLVGNVADMSATCRPDMSATCRPDTRCRSNSGQMGPCRRHKI